MRNGKAERDGPAPRTDRGTDSPAHTPRHPKALRPPRQSTRTTSPDGAGTERTRGAQDDARRRRDIARETPHAGNPPRSDPPHVPPEWYTNGTSTGNTCPSGLTLMEYAVRLCGSQAELARRLGMTRHRVNDMLGQKRPISVATISKLCFVLSIPPDHARRIVAHALVEDAKTETEYQQRKKTLED